MVWGTRERVWEFYTCSRWCVGSTLVCYNSKHVTTHIHCLHWYVVVFLPLPLLLEHTTQAGWEGLPLEQDGTLPGTWRSLNRAIGGRALRRWLGGWMQSSTSPRSCLASSMQNCLWSSLRPGCSDSLYIIYALTIALSKRWKKARLHHLIVRWLNP